ncbi:hypothetical protein BKA56DRAFT_496806 [Ilyonectria sp. MPI-CAGE-AT-0026]|nr:hypothetical protein BKA56DRAFT_496806 [Ilyonectria sp. MPI-CAGE-AT-0026]
MSYRPARQDGRWPFPLQSTSPSPSPSPPPPESLSSPLLTDIRLENITGARDSSSPGAAGQTEQQQHEAFTPGKRLRGPGENILALLLWVLFAAATSASWVLQYRLQPSNAATEYGFKATTNGMCKDLKSPATSKGMFLLLVNAATSVVAAIVAYFRSGLLAPSPAAYQKSKGRLYLGVESGRGFLHASWPRKVMYVVLLGASLPLYFLSNSLVFTKYPAYNAYEVLVSTTFFNGRPFDLAGVNMTRYASLEETVTMPSPDLQWPDEYGASSGLNRSLARLQQGPTVWKNLSRASCLEQFNEALYTRYRTLVLVTDYDSDSDSNTSNSALAASVLPGYRLKSASSSLVALCPDKYLETYKDTMHPTKTPFMTLDKSNAWPWDVTFLSPAEANEWATNGSLSADVSALKRDMPGGSMAQNADTFNPMPGRDLCYHYWADDDRWVSNTTRIYRVPQCRLLYCLAEPVETPRMCQVVYSPRVLFILSVFLSCLLVVISVALVLRCVREGLYSREDASEYFRYEQPPLRPVWCKEFCSKYSSGSSMFHHRRMPRHLAVLSFVVFVYVYVLWDKAGNAGEDIKYPSGPKDDGWLFKALALNKALHIVFEVQLYFQAADVQKRFFRVTRGRDYQDPGPEGFLQRMWRKIYQLFRRRETYLTLLLAIRSFLVHFTYGLIFITQLMGVASLEEVAGTIVGTKSLAFTTLGVPAFNERSEKLNFLFLLFNWFIFVALPSSLLDVIFYAIAKCPPKKEQVRSVSTVALTLIVWFSTMLVWAPIYGRVHPFP